MFDVVQDNVIEKVVNNRNENVCTYLYKISLIFNNNNKIVFILKDIQGICDDLLVTTMKSYVQTQRDDILIMVCKLDIKK